MAKVDQPTWIVLRCLGSYGTKLTLNGDISLAGKYLRELGLIQGQFANGGDLVDARLESDGYTCLEDFGGDPTAMRSNMRANVNIEQIHNHSNLAIGSHDVAQKTSLPGNYFLSAADLAPVMEQIAGHPISTAAAAAEAKAAAHDLDRADCTGEIDLSVLGRAATIFRYCASSLQDEPVAAAALTALAQILSPQTEGGMHDR